MKRNKIKQLSVMLSLMILSKNDINSLELDNLLGNSHYIYQEIDNPEYGDYLIHAFISLPSYIKKFLADNSLEIIVSGKNDYIENIYRKLYPDQDIENKAGVTIDYAGKLIAAVEGCSFDEEIPLSLHGNYSEEQLIKANLTLLMYHQVGHLIDRYFDNMSNSKVFLNCFSYERFHIRYIISSFLGSNDDFTMYEFFATSYACYLAYPKYFENICPLTYNFFDTYLKELITTKNETKSIDIFRK